MIIEKEKVLWKPRNAGIACGGSAYIGIYAPGVNIRIFHLMRNIYIMKEQAKAIELMVNGIIDTIVEG